MGRVMSGARRVVARALRPLARRLVPRLGRRTGVLVLTAARALGRHDRAVAVLLTEARRRFDADDPERARQLLDAVSSSRGTAAHSDATERRSRAARRRLNGARGANGDLTGVDPKLLVQEIRALTDCHDLDRALDLAERSARAHPHALRPTDLLIGLLDCTGDSDRALGLAVENAERRRRRLERLRDRTRPERHLTRDTRILVSGYFYSGSGAVLDWLLDFPGTVKWTPAGELRLLKFPGGFDDLAKRHADQGRLTAQDLVDLYLHITGWKVTLSPRGTYDQWALVNRSSRRMFRRERAFGYLAVLLECFLELARDPSASATTEELETRLRRHIERALDAAATDSEATHLVIDQAITAWRLQLARFMPPATFVSVHRDPRDQFAEAREVLAQPGRNRTNPEKFVKQYRRNRRKVDRLAPGLEQDQGHRVLRVGFEEFVVDHDRTSAWLATELGFDPAARVPDRFHPEVSRRNVGKHLTALAAEEREILEAELAEYLSPHADAALAE